MRTANNLLDVAGVKDCEKRVAQILTTADNAWNGVAKVPAYKEFTVAVNGLCPTQSDKLVNIHCDLVEFVNSGDKYKMVSFFYKTAKKFSTEQKQIESALQQMKINAYQKSKPLDSGRKDEFPRSRKGK